MSWTRMWVLESDQDGTTTRKFSIEDPQHIPRVGEFIDSDSASGWVDHVQYYYNTPLVSGFSLVVHVHLRKEK